MGHKAIGEIKVVGGDTTQVTSGDADTYTLITGFNEDEGSSGFALNITPDKTANKITTIFGGPYKASFNVSFTGTVVKTYKFQLFCDGSPTGIITGRTIGTGAGGDLGACEFANRGLLVGAGIDVDMRVASSGTTDNFVPIEMALVLEKL